MIGGGGGGLRCGVVGHLPLSAPPRGGRQTVSSG